ncbi:MAG: hypothetical protein OQK57_05965, partial [Ignavibacteriaceae bacterium]|nr:hypothetical protein [Ignavibacteriaceae bacterium]
FVRKNKKSLQTCLPSAGFHSRGIKFHYAQHYFNSLVSQLRYSINLYKINLSSKTNLKLATTLLLVYLKVALQKKIEIKVNFIKNLII